MMQAASSSLENTRENFGGLNTQGESPVFNKVRTISGDTIENDRKTVIMQTNCPKYVVSKDRTVDTTTTL